MIKVQFTTKLPPAVSVPLPLFKFKLLYVPATMVCAPVVAAYVIVPPQVFPEGIGVALAVFVVLIAPLFVIVPNVPDKVYVVISKKPLPLVVVKAPFTTKLPPAGLPPLVLLKVKLL